MDSTIITNTSNLNQRKRQMTNQKLGLNMNGGAGGKYMNGDDLDNLGNNSVINTNLLIMQT